MNWEANDHLECTHSEKRACSHGKTCSHGQACTHCTHSDEWCQSSNRVRALLAVWAISMEQWFLPLAERLKPEVLCRSRQILSLYCALLPQYTCSISFRHLLCNKIFCFVTKFLALCSIKMTRLNSGQSFKWVRDHFLYELHCSVKANNEQEARWIARPTLYQSIVDANAVEIYCRKFPRNKSNLLGLSDPKHTSFALCQ